MKKFLALLLLVLAFALPASAETYVETVKGMFDGLKVEVTLTNGKIEGVKVLEHHETDTGIPAIDLLPKQIVEAQSIGIDGISGATMTSNGIKSAVEAALKKAGLDVSKYQAKSAPKKDMSYFPIMGSFQVPEKWDETYDVVVVGAGFAGMAAAYSAGEAGAKTLIIEKLSTTGGNSATNGGQYAAYTSKLAAALQKKYNLVPDTAAKHIEDTMNGGDLMSRKELVEEMVMGSPYYFNLLLDNGLEIRDTLARPGGHYGYRTYVTKEQIGADITNVQRKMLDKQKNVTLELNTKMVEIYRTRDAGNKVVGIRVAQGDKYKTIKAEKGVILATGGFSSNVKMRETQVPYLTKDIPTTNIKAASTGEGIYLAQAVGANTMQMSNIQRYPWADPNTGVLDKYAVWPFTGPSYGVIYVDWQGKRYVNEGDRRDVCANAAANSGFISTYAIFTKPIVTFTVAGEVEAGVAEGRVLEGKTIEELVEKINAFPIKGQYPKVTVENLKDTIAKHNSYIDKGVDPDFGKVMAATMVKIEDGPYYAIPQYPSVHHTMGGLVITTKTEVVDIFGNVIPGLYAAGEVTGGVHGTNRLGSNADADSCTLGFISGYVVATGNMPTFMFDEKANSGK
ncbi:MAG: flavocytochrome c [Synergistaceae bacterium]|nr:flavocytochrome c [Synergistaceae bacterium]MBR0075550.1 flavocytochrome c [Synergistaceae bacterium]MBR0315848.1 flavocytochrome c [Synergistaceae bacterium]